MSWFPFYDRLDDEIEDDETAKENNEIDEGLLDLANLVKKESSTLAEHILNTFKSLGSISYSRFLGSPCTSQSLLTYQPQVIQDRPTVIQNNYKATFAISLPGTHACLNKYGARFIPYEHFAQHCEHILANADGKVMFVTGGSSETGETKVYSTVFPISIFTGVKPNNNPMYIKYKGEPPYKHYPYEYGGALLEIVWDQDRLVYAASQKIYLHPHDFDPIKTWVFSGYSLADFKNQQPMLLEEFEKKYPVKTL